MVRWRDRTRKAWEWWERFDAAQGLVSFLHHWGWLAVLAGTWGLAIVSIVVALILFMVQALSGLWFVGVTIAAILVATVPNIILFRLGLRPSWPAEAAAAQEPTAEGGTITITEPVVVPEDAAMTEDQSERGETVEDAESTGEPPDRVYIRRGEWHEVYWQAWRLPNKYVDVEGPYCPRDYGLLLFWDGQKEVAVEDYQEVRPPETYLVCSQCKHKYYLTATDREPQRVGDSRSYAGWRLDGGKTRSERIRDMMGL